MNDTTQQLVFGILIPLVVVGVIVANPRLDRFAWRVPLALAFPVALAFLADRWGGPTEQWHHAGYVPVAGAVVGILMALPPRTTRWRAWLYIALGALAMIAIWPVVRREPWWLRLLPALATIGMMIGLEPLAARRPGPGFTLAVTLAAATSSVIVLVSGSFTQALPYASLVVGLGVCAAFAVWRRRFSLAGGALAVVVPMLVVLPFVRWLYFVSEGGGIPVWVFVVPSAAPLLMWLGEAPPLRDRPPAATFAVRLVPVAIACAIALGGAFGWGGGGDDDDDSLDDMYRDMMGARPAVTDRA